MADLSGLDVGYKIRKGKQLTEGSDGRESNGVKEGDRGVSTGGAGRGERGGGEGAGKGVRYSRIGDELYLLGRLGVKNGKGFYRYTAKNNAANIGIVDKEVEGVIECETIRRNSTQRQHTHTAHALESALVEGARERVDELITQRLLYPLVNEAFKLLEQGGVVSGRPGDVDIVFLRGQSPHATRVIGSVVGLLLFTWSHQDRVLCHFSFFPHFLSCFCLSLSFSIFLSLYPSLSLFPLSLSQFIYLCTIFNSLIYYFIPLTQGTAGLP